MAHNQVLKEQHEIVPPNPTELEPLQLRLLELMANPACKCRQSCLISLIDDSMGRASLVILMDKFRKLTRQDRTDFFTSYAKEDNCVQP